MTRNLSKIMTKKIYSNQNIKKAPFIGVFLLV